MQIEPFQSGFTTPDGVSYSTGSSFSNRLRALAALLGAGEPLRCVALNGAGGYDTHSDQEASLPQNLSVTAGSLLAFERDLEARGLADRVLTLVWSEFGRRPQENGSGTDHGAAGTGFLIGSAARGTMIGEFPGIAANDLDEDDNLRATADFRDLSTAACSSSGCGRLGADTPEWRRLRHTGPAQAMIRPPPLVASRG